ncbi:MAG: PD-(D/E)XK nuclease family protein [Chitinophagaceae bacterium]|nr:PD-(D/E)XK nuclease family protein [Chitinophagaceae bacterium]
MIEKTQHLLTSAHTILQNHKALEKSKGECFNLFSILKLEKSETKAHTPFLYELLNPEGSHLMGHVFLEKFLAIPSIANLPADKKPALQSTKVFTNKPIGARVIDDGKEKGGSLDLYLQDKNNIAITIENKIDAFTEQPKQVVRYCNYNKKTNTVFYLTPQGTEPSRFSKDNLESGKDFYILSYKDDIIPWLTQCLEETASSPILRESLRQYIILLKKITFTMDNHLEKEMQHLMIANFEEAEYISQKFKNALHTLTEQFRQETIIGLIERLNKDFNVYAGDNTANLYSQIWIKYKEFDNATLYFGIESFSPHFENTMDVGILSEKGMLTEYVNGEKSEDSIWPYYLTLEDFDGLEINLGNPALLKRINSDHAFRKNLMLHIINSTESFINTHKESLYAFLKNKTEEVK